MDIEDETTRKWLEKYNNYSNEELIMESLACLLNMTSKFENKPTSALVGILLTRITSNTDKT